MCYEQTVGSIDTCPSVSASLKMRGTSRLDGPNLWWTALKWDKKDLAIWNVFPAQVWVFFCLCGLWSTADYFIPFYILIFTQIFLHVFLVDNKCCYWFTELNKLDFDWYTWLNLHVLSGNKILSSSQEEQDKGTRQPCKRTPRAQRLLKASSETGAVASELAISVK